MKAMLTPLYKQKNVRLLWGAQALQSFSQILLTVAVIADVYERANHSVLGAASVLACMSAAGFLGGLFASRYIQQFSFIGLLHGIGWARAVLACLMIPPLSWQHPAALILILIILFVFSFIGAWYSPLRFALLPLLVSRDEYVRANGTTSLIHQVLQLAGWAAGGLLVSHVAAPAILGIASGGFLLSGLLSKRIASKGQPASGKPRPARLVVPLWKKMYQVPLIRTITLMDLLETLANAIWSSALLLAFTKTVLGKNEEWWGLLNGAYFIGAFIGSYAAVSAAKLLQRKTGIMIGVSAFCMGILTALFALSPLPIVAFLLCLGMGPFYQIRDICQETVLQDALEEAERAPMLAAREAILAPWAGMSYVIMGYLADLTSIATVYLLAAGLYLFSFVLFVSQSAARAYRFSPDPPSPVQTESPAKRDKPAS